MIHKFFKTKEEISTWLKSKNIQRFTLVPDKVYGFVVDVRGSVNLQGAMIMSIPVKFNVVSGDFNCAHNGLTTLLGSPNIVKGYFNCSNNSLTNLVGSPHEVGYFTCAYSQLTSLKGGPIKVKRDFACIYNNLTNLIGSPQMAVRNFIVDNNLLTSLEGITPYIKGGLTANDNKIDTLLYIPKKINKVSYLKGNPHSFLIDLENLISYSQLHDLHKIDADKKSLNDNLQKKNTPARQINKL